MNEVLSQLHARKSVRAFLDRPISPEARRAILEAACAAPTVGNQHTYFVLWDAPEGDAVWEEKLNFFYRYPELVEFRTQARARLGL